MIMFSVIDQLWKDHLLNMDHLKEGIGLRGYAQHDPLVEYKRESFDMFEEMMQRFQEDTVRYLYLMQIFERPRGSAPSEASPEDRPSLPSTNGRRPRNVSTSVDEIEHEFQRKKKRELQQAKMAGGGAEQAPVQQVVRSSAKVGRNDPCPCGSGKKFKKCHGASE
jgi:preprotein translocase subunit SecA